MVESSTSNPKLAKMRDLLRAHELQAYCVFHNDAHTVRVIMNDGLIVRIPR